jgi:hypothetical protein
MDISNHENSIEFSKILITGPVHPSMPFIVLKELAFECGIIASLDKLKNNPLYYAKIFKKVAKLSPKLIEDLSRPRDFEKACLMVNPLEDWNQDREGLWSCLMFLGSFVGLYKEDGSMNRKIYSFQKFGLQNRFYRYSYNACILFTIAKQQKINIELDISYNELFNKVAQNYNQLPILIIDHSEDEIEDVLPPQQRTVEDRTAEVRTVENRTAENRTVENRTAENRTVENRTAENRTAENRTENRTAEEDITVFDRTVNIEDLEDLSISSIDIDKLESVDKQVILSFDITSNKSFDFCKEFQTIQTIGELFDDVDYVRRQFQPQNSVQAIVAGALNFFKDFSMCNNPFEEFDLFFYKLESDYEPKDPALKHIIMKNPNYSDLWMYFNPYLPKTLYKSNLLKHHLKLFSYPVSEFMDIGYYESLQELHLEENFHLGWYPTIKNKETPIMLEQVENLLSEEIVCYGVRDENLIAMTWQELAELFDKMKLFVNPTAKKSLFPTLKIERLIKLAKWTLIVDPFCEHRHLFFYFKESTKESIRKCLNICETLILTQQDEFKSLQKYLQAYQEMLNGDQILIRETMERFFETIMYMRGWKGPQWLHGNQDLSEIYPISHVPYCDPNETEKRTLESLMQLDLWNQDCNNFVYQLPLILWKNEFYLSNQEDQGLTIGDRIEIIKKGETSEGISSCIRMSSNVLGASYCFYSKFFGFQIKFEIQDLHPIQ